MLPLLSVQLVWPSVGVGLMQFDVAVGSVWVCNGIVGSLLLVGVVANAQRSFLLTCIVMLSIGCLMQVYVDAVADAVLVRAVSYRC